MTGQTILKHWVGGSLPDRVIVVDIGSGATQWLLREP